MAPSGGPLLSMSNANLYGGMNGGQLLQQSHHGHLGDSGAPHMLPSVAMAPVPLAEFATHIDRQKMNNNQGFIHEFESIDTGQQFTWENSAMEVNKHKNRLVISCSH